MLLTLLYTVQYFRAKDINYQIGKLENGTTKQKIKAIEFIAEKNAYEEIPKIMPYIDSEDSILYYGKTSYTLTCAVTLALETMTNKNYGNTCDSSHSKTDDQIMETKKEWKGWYSQEYLK